MSAAEILASLPNLDLEDRWAIGERLAELGVKEEIVPDQEMADAIEVGLRSAETEPTFTIAEALDNVKQ